jgi:hypothetical protein
MSEERHITITISRQMGSGGAKPVYSNPISKNFIARRARR